MDMGFLGCSTILRNRQADRVSNILLDLVLQQNSSTNLQNTVKSLGGDPAIFDAEDEVDEEEY